MAKHNYEVTLGGDDYLVTLPTHRLLYDILSFPGLTEELSMDLRKDVLCQERSTANIRAFVPFIPPTADNSSPDIWYRQERFFLLSLETNKISTTRYARFLYRPILVPLDRNGHWDETLKAQNPDGSIVSGFEIRWSTCEDGEVVPFLTDGFGRHPRKWMWWDGILVGLEPKVAVAASVLHRFDLISDSLELAGRW